MFKANKKCSRGRYSSNGCLPLLMLALDVRLGLGRCCCCSCCCSSPGSFLMVEVDYLVKAIGCNKCRCVLFSSLHLLSPQYRNLMVPIPDVVIFPVFLSSLFFCFSLLFADLAAGLVLLIFFPSCPCF